MSGAELVKLNLELQQSVAAYLDPVGDELFDDVKFQIDYNLAMQHFNHRITDGETRQLRFRAEEQVSQAQIDLLGAAFILATGGPAQTHIGTGTSGSHSDLHWNGKKNLGKKR